MEKKIIDIKIKRKTKNCEIIMRRKLPATSEEAFEVLVVQMAQDPLTPDDVVHAGVGSEILDAGKIINAKINE